ncbi:MAG: shikimate kinase, partial [Pseudomonadota bacterium]|nr:shikimate kinase [Pseudomonadota bacterium]
QGLSLKPFSWHKLAMDKFDEAKIERIRDNLDKPLVIIGLMGAGKTRIGKQLASSIGLDFYDSDDEIEQAAGMPVSEIFERFGEAYFRDGERRVIERLVDESYDASSHYVIATGGGAIMTQETQDLLLSKTHLVWVRADIDVMVERTARRDTRPLLKNGDPREILTTLMNKRYPVYEKADIVVESHNGPVEAVMNQALDKIYNFLRYDNRQTG